MILSIPRTLQSTLLALVWLALASGGLVSHAQAADSPPAGRLLSAAGSTFAAPIFERWIADYEADHSWLQISYDAVGSGDGIRLFLANKVMLGATDAPLKPDERSQAGAEVLELPVTAGMIALAYNLPGYEGRLNLPRDVYTDIFLGRIERWNDPRIQTANPKADLPDWSIHVVARLDSSGTTFAFTNHLAAISPDWAAGPGIGKLIDWPGSAMVARGNEGVAQRIKLGQGTIGYVEAGLAQRLGLPQAWLENRSGHFVEPTAETGQQALAAGALHNAGDLTAVQTDPDGADAYPIVTYTWLLLRHPKNPSELDRIGNDFARWIMTDGQAQASPLGYVPLPETLVEAGLAELDGHSLPSM